MLPYVETKSSVFERDISESAKPRVILKYSPMLTPKGNDLISIKDNSYVVYTFECCCKNSYIGQTSRNLRTRIKEHIEKCVEDYIKTESETTNTAITNGMKMSSIAKLMINRHRC